MVHMLKMFSLDVHLLKMLCSLITNTMMSAVYFDKYTQLNWSFNLGETCTNTIQMQMP
jgi:hypothetical protein